LNKKALSGFAFFAKPPVFFEIGIAFFYALCYIIFKDLKVRKETGI